MRRLLFVMLAAAILTMAGCQTPGDPSPYGGSGGTYNSNTADEANNANR